MVEEDTKISAWEEIDPHLKLERIRVRNFRNIRDLDVTIPEDKNIICLVGPNGGGKSALLSVIINALCNLTDESVPDRNDEGVTLGFSKFRLSWSREEIGSDGPAFGLVMNWKSEYSDFGYKFLVANHESVTHRFTKNLCKEFGFSEKEYMVNQWDISAKRDVPLKISEEGAGDPIAKSVILFRPSDRFETPYYEGKQNRSVSPRTEFNWSGNRPYPIGSKSGLLNLESFILDMTLDNKLEYRHASLANDNLIKALKIIRKGDEEFVVRPWPFRRVGLGRLEALSLLSAGELDILVTVGDIISQQVYLLEKFNPGGDHEITPSGWVFIDEVDSHLHPQWQQKVLPVLSELFPTINFMVTTHSPFVLRSLPENRSLVIRLPDGEVFDDDFSSWRIDDILDVVFNIPSLWSPEVEKKLEQLQDFISEPEHHEKATDIYSELANRGNSLRSACDRIVAVYGSPEIRDRIVKLNETQPMEENLHEAG
ncbi:AAA family ATPase [Desulfobacterales bacterium HSG2]|nr:AAA family ATPase [Desulfobacterales bacterium HSG2]